MTYSFAQKSYGVKKNLHINGKSLSLYLYIYISIYPTIYLSIYLSIYLFIYLSIIFFCYKVDLSARSAQDHFVSLSLRSFMNGVNPLCFRFPLLNSRPLVKIILSLSLFRTVWVLFVLCFHYWIKDLSARSTLVHFISLSALF